MWQRIQTLYLLVSTGLMVSLLFCEKSAGVRYTVYLPYVILIGIITVLNVLALTTYRHRIFQMRTCILSALITVALQAWMAVDFFTADERTVFSVTMVFPVVCVILDVLAAAGVWSDEMVVQSAGRLRSRKKK